MYFFESLGTVKIKYYLIRLYVRLMLYIGTFLSRFVRCKPPRKINSILINRSDRLGDAFISIPIIFELQKKYNVTVICSKYNEFVFLKANIKTITFDQNLVDQNQESYTHRMIRHLRPAVFRVVSDPFDIFLNFSGTNNVKLHSSAKKIYKVGFKFGFSPLKHDYSVHTFHTQNYVQSLIDMIKWFDKDFSYAPHFLDFALLRDKTSNVFIPEDNYIVFHIGAKFPRLIEQQKLIDLLNNLPIKTLIIDNPNEDSLKNITSYITNSNISIIRQNLTLFELFNITSNKMCKLFIGYDSGSSHLLHFNTNCIILYTACNHNGWRPFTNNKWVALEEHPDCVIESSTIDDLKKYIAYVPLKCRTCYDIMCNNPVCKNLDVNPIIKLITTLTESS